MTRRFTGRHMTLIMVAFFGTVVAVNVTMARFAASTFGGTVVDNSYVASQQFNGWLRQARAQERLGWTARLALDKDRRLSVRLRNSAGAFDDAVVEALVRHPLGRAPERRFRLPLQGQGRYRSAETIGPGRWIVHLDVRHRDQVMKLVETVS